MATARRMAGSRGSRSAVAVGTLRRSRASLLGSTALQAAVLVVLAFPAQAQLSPNARPQVGLVVAGQASISQTATVTTVQQASQRAAVNWQSFNVGSAQTVDFVQPSSSSVTLNRVVGGDPSEIAGHIVANGNVILVNGSGVVFDRGSQVDVNSLVVSAADTTNKGFMAGKTNFSIPGSPNAMVVNNGTITVKQSGLAALVAPAVANHGVINARMGTVVLAGATTATVDLYGDGLLAIDVTGQVTQVPVGADGRKVTALVTNTGTILAQGGSVTLTAAAADGIVTNLVTAGGTISADGGRGRGGTIVLGGIGGSLVIEGDITATGATGGAVQALADGGVTVASTAKIDVSGRSRGGTVALGTTLARAAAGPSLTSAPKAASVTVARGAVVQANATRKGNGGTITVLSSNSTVMAGTLSARGGPQGGNGGFIEVSGDGSYRLTGSVDVRAPLGQPGAILIDPANLTIEAGGTVVTLGTLTASDTLLGDQATLDPRGLTGSVLLQAGTDIVVASPISGTGVTDLTMQAGRNLTVSAAINVTGSLVLQAATSQVSGSLTVGASLSAGGGIALTSVLTTGTGGIAINAAVTNSGSGGIALTDYGTGGVKIAGAVTNSGSGGVTVNTLGTLGITGTGSLVAAGQTVGLIAASVSQAPAGVISAGTLTATATSGSVDLSGAANSFAVLGSGGAATGYKVVDGGSLSVPGTIASGLGVLSISAPTLSTSGSLSAPVVRLQIDALSLTGSILAGSGVVAIMPNSTNGTIYLQNAAGVGGTGTLVLSGTELANGVQAGALLLGSRDGITATNTGSIIVNGTLFAPGVLGLFSLGRISEDPTNGAIKAVSLIGKAGTGIVLASSLNAIGTLGLAAPLDINGAHSVTGLTALAGITLTNSTDLTVVGLVNGTSGGTTIDTATNPLTVASGGTVQGSGAVRLNAGALVLDGLVTDGGGGGGSGTVTLNAILGGISETGALVAGTLTGSAGGAVTLTSANNRIGRLDAFTAAGFRLNDGHDLTVVGVVNGTSGNVSLEASNTIALVSGVSIGAGGDVVLATDSITGGGAPAIQLSGGTLSSGGNVYLLSGPGGSVSVGATGKAQAGGTLSIQTDTLTVMNGATLAGPTIQLAPGTTGTTVSLGAGAATGLAIDATVLGVLHGFTTLSIGAASAPSGTTTAGSIAVVGAVNIGAATLALFGTGDITGLGPITANKLTATATTGSVDLSGAANSFAVLGSGSAATGYKVVDGGSLSVPGTIVSGLGVLSISAPTLSTSGSLSAPVVRLTASADTLTLGGHIAGGTSLTLLGSIDIAAAGAVLSGGTLTATATSGSVDLGNAANSFAVLGSGSAATGYKVVDGGSLSVPGTIASASGVLSISAPTLSTSGSLSAPVVDLTASVGMLTVAAGGTVAGGSAVAMSGNGIALAGMLTSNGTVTLVSGGAIDEASSGAISADILTGGAGGAATLTGTNLVANLGSFSALGFTFTDGRDLTVTGNVNGAALAVLTLPAANKLTVASGGTVQGTSVTLTAGALSLAGLVADPSGGTVTLTAITGGITETGTLVADTLTGSAVGAVDLSGAQVNLQSYTTVNQVGTLGVFNVTGTDSRFVLYDSTSLLVGGNISAFSIQIGAVTRLAVAGGVTITTGSDPVPPVPQAQAPKDSSGTKGLNLAILYGAGTIDLGPNLTIQGTPGAVNQTVRLALPGGGLIQFGNFNAHTADLLLHVGSGSARSVPGDAIDVHALSAFYQSGSNGPIDLTGSVNGQVGNAAATASRIGKEPNPPIPFGTSTGSTYVPGSNFRMNQCAITSVNCALVLASEVPPPLRQMDTTFVLPQEALDDPDLLLPYISDRDD